MLGSDEVKAIVTAIKNTGLFTTVSRDLHLPEELVPSDFPAVYVFGGVVKAKLRFSASSVQKYGDRTVSLYVYHLNERTPDTAMDELDTLSNAAIDAVVKSGVVIDEEFTEDYDSAFVKIGLLFNNFHAKGFYCQRIDIKIHKD